MNERESILKKRAEKGKQKQEEKKYNFHVDKRENVFAYNCVEFLFALKNVFTVE